MSKHIYLKSKENKISIEKSTDPSKLILKNYPRGIYTSARTWERTNVYDYKGHIERLLFGLQRIRYKNKENEEIDNNDNNYEEEKIKNVLEPLRNYQTLYDMITKLLQMAMLAFFQENSKDELKITILISFDYELLLPEINIHIEKLITNLNPSVKVGTALVRRKNAEIKDSQWTKERSVFEEKLKDVNEIIMYDNDNNFYEGLSSNFYIEMKSKIYSAPEGSVLKGTMSKLVFSGCKEKNIEIIREFPNANNINEWDGAFITSTSRLVLPISKIIFKNEEINIPISSNIKTIRQYVNDSLKNNSTKIINDII